MDSTEARFLELETRLDAMQAQLNACMASPTRQAKRRRRQVESSAAAEHGGGDRRWGSMSHWVRRCSCAANPSATSRPLTCCCCSSTAWRCKPLPVPAAARRIRAHRTADDDGTVADLLGWRRTVAHDYKYYNRCGSSRWHSWQASWAMIELSDGQRALYSGLLGYLGEGDGIGASGMIMAALAAWFLTMLKELADCWPSRRPSCRPASDMTVGDDGGATVASASRARRPSWPFSWRARSSELRC